MPQLVETQPKRTGYPIAAGVMIIVCACWDIVLSSISILLYPGDFVRFAVSSVTVSIGFSILSLLGGVQALIGKRFL